MRKALGLLLLLTVAGLAQRIESRNTSKEDWSLAETLSHVDHFAIQVDSRRGDSGKVAMHHDYVDDRAKVMP